MYICICHSVTDNDINHAIKKGACSMNDLSTQLKVGTCCGRCKSCVKGLLNQSVVDSTSATNALLLLKTESHVIQK
jgi:bacterioferritin-associated ferredoxin